MHVPKRLFVFQLKNGKRKTNSMHLKHSFPKKEMKVNNKIKATVNFFRSEVNSRRLGVYTYTCIYIYIYIAIMHNYLCLCTKQYNTTP